MDVMEDGEHDQEPEPDLVIVTSDDPLPPGLPLPPLPQPQSPQGPQAEVQDENNRNRTRLLHSGRSKRQIQGRAASASARLRRLEAASFASMKPNVVVDEMFPEGAGPYVDIDEAGGSSGLLMDLAANEKSVHTEFFNQFDDLYDDEDLS